VEENRVHSTVEIKLPFPSGKNLQKEFLLYFTIGLSDKRFERKEISFLLTFNKHNNEDLVVERSC